MSQRSFSPQKPIPSYAKVKQAIYSKIASGEWQPNDRVPSEAELVQEFGLSRMTVNRALRELAAEGLLVRLQGVGSFVAQPKGESALFAIRSIADEIAARHHHHRCEVISLTELHATPSLARALNVKEGGRLFHSLLVHYENDIPIQIEDRHVNAEAVPGYLQQDFSLITPHAYLSRIAPLTEGEHIVEAILASPEECGLLQIEAGEPCLLINRRTWSAHHTVSHARLIFPGSRHRLEGHFSS